jgi:hypothetical protein
MSQYRLHARHAVYTALLATLTGCGGGGGDSDPPPSSGNPPAPAPAPAPVPPPAPPPAPAVPPLSSVVTNLDTEPDIGTPRWPSGNTATGGTGQVVQGLECLPNMPDGYHVHTHVSIIVDGVHQAFPANVGINPTPRCFYGIHTHDLSGKIHVEAAAPGTFTLGQLFAIWGQPLEADNVAGITGKPVEVFSTENATVTRVTTDWDEIELTSKKLITIQVGTPIAEIPNFNWTGN